MFSYLRPLAAASVLVASATSTAAAAPPTPEAKPSVMASFEGGWIRLADDWDVARACTSDGVSTRCYSSESEMDAVEGPLNQTSAQTTASSLTDCALPAVRLYQSTAWTGTVLQLTARFTTINLAPYGFDNVTSSYRIGVCPARFYDTTSGGTLYPGSTSAGASASSMVAGWDNRVGSVYIS